jgi:hypothetical protein
MVARQLFLEYPHPRDIIETTLLGQDTQSYWKCPVLCPISEEGHSDSSRSMGDFATLRAPAALASPPPHPSKRGMTLIQCKRCIKSG